MLTKNLIAGDGDQGGPLMILEADGQRTQIGVFSYQFSLGCGLGWPGDYKELFKCFFESNLSSLSSQPCTRASLPSSTSSNKIPTCEFSKLGSNRDAAPSLLLLLIFIER